MPRAFHVMKRVANEMTDRIAEARTDRGAGGTTDDRTDRATDEFACAADDVAQGSEEAHVNLLMSR